MKNLVWTGFHRGYEIDHHSPDRPFINFDKVDLKEYDRLLGLLHIDHLVFYCKDHYGLAYYDTRVGKKHPRLKVDLVKEIVKILRRRKIGFVAYYSVGFDEHIAQTRPEWAMRDEEGKMIQIRDVPEATRKWHWICSATAYQEYCTAMLQEIVAGYQPDAVFLDIFPDFVCYCDICRKEFKDRFGFNIPVGIEKERFWKPLGQFREMTQYNAIKKIVRAIRQTDQKVGVSLNSAHMEFTRKTLDLVDYTSTEPWAGNYLSAAFARDTGTFPMIIPGRVTMVFDPQKPSVYIMEQSAVFAQNVRTFFYSNSMYPDGHLDEQEFKNIGIAYREVKKFQEYCLDRKPVRSVGILYSESSRMWDPDSRHKKSLNGALRLAAFTKYPFEVVPEWKWDKLNLSGFDLVVAPEVGCLTTRQAEIFRNYVRSGGKIVSTGSFGTLDTEGKQQPNFILNDVLGCDYLTINKTYADQVWGSYLDRVPHLLWKTLPSTMFAVAPPLIEVKVTDGQTLAYHRLPCTLMNDENWVNWWPAPPVNDPADLPAVHQNQFEKGKSIYFSFDLTGMAVTTSQYGHFFRWPYDLFLSLVEYLVPQPPVRVITSTPRGLGTTFYQRDKELIIHFLNLTINQMGGEVMSLDGGVIHLEGPFSQAKSATIVYPDKKELTLSKTRYCTEIKIPAINLHTVVVIKQ